MSKPLVDMVHALDGDSPKTPDEADKLAARAFGEKLDSMLPSFREILPADSPLLKEFQQEAEDAAVRIRVELESAIERHDLRSVRTLARYLDDQMSRELGPTHETAIHSCLTHCQLLADKLDESEQALDRAKAAVAVLDENNNPNHQSVASFCLLIARLCLRRATDESTKYLNRGIAVAAQHGLDAELNSLIQLLDDVPGPQQAATRDDGSLASGGRHDDRTEPATSSHQLVTELVTHQLPLPTLTIEELLGTMHVGLDEVIETGALNAADSTERLSKFVAEELEPTCDSLGDSGGEVWQLLHDRATRHDADRISTTALFLSSVFPQFRDVSVEDMVLLVVATVDLLTQDE